jgi:hypothetical protein
VSHYAGGGCQEEPLSNLGMTATSMNHEARQVRASVEGLIRRVNRNSAGLIGEGHNSHQRLLPHKHPLAMWGTAWGRRDSDTCWANDGANSQPLTAPGAGLVLASWCIRRWNIPWSSMYDMGLG